MDTLGSSFSLVAFPSTNLVLVDQCSDLGGQRGKSYVEYNTKS